MLKRLSLPAVLIVLLISTSATLKGQKHVTSPREQFGHDIGDDYFLVNYAQMVEYWKNLTRESDRMRTVEIGKTAEERTMIMAIVTASENQQKLSQYQS